MSTPFDFGLGRTQGRIEDADAPQGEHVFELGCDGGAGKARVAVGDYSEVSQVIVHDSTELFISCTVTVVEPAEEDPSLAWDLVGLVDGAAFYRRRLLGAGRALTLTDIGLSLGGATSPTTIAYRLEAVTP